MTGDVQWEYPQVETLQPASDDVDTADDAMDICTTPPPNEHENLTAVIFQATGKCTDLLPNLLLILRIR